MYALKIYNTKNPPTANCVGDILSYDWTLLTTRAYLSGANLNAFI